MALAVPLNRSVDDRRRKPWLLTPVAVLVAISASAPHPVLVSAGTPFEALIVANAGEAPNSLSATAQPMNDVFQSTPIANDVFVAQQPVVAPLPAATAAGLTQPSTQLLGANPDLTRVSTAAQLQIQWYAA
jgi:hypothetical protein